MDQRYSADLPAERRAQPMASCRVIDEASHLSTQTPQWLPRGCLPVTGSAYSRLLNALSLSMRSLLDTPEWPAMFAGVWSSEPLSLAARLRLSSSDR